MKVNKIEFKVGDIIDTKGNSNMPGKVRVRSTTGNSLYFTDKNGIDYHSFAKSTARVLIKEGVWRLT